VYECPRNYFVSGNLCVMCAENCLSCNSQDSDDCNSCENTFYLLDGECLRECPEEGYYHNHDIN
jgi:proprotein convertase subtilisin/kexin type 5